MREGERTLVRRASLPALVRYVLACILLLGTALPFAVASPAPAAGAAKQPTATSKPLSVITPTGAGSFRDVPPKSQDASDALEPCSSQTVECTVTWKSGSTVCKEQGTASSCTTLYQGQHATLAEAQEQCERIHGVRADSGAQSCASCQVAKSAKNDCLEHCKDLCYKAWEKCRDDCPRGDKNCLSECTNTLASCNRECDRKCK